MSKDNFGMVEANFGPVVRPLSRLFIKATKAHAMVDTNSIGFLPADVERDRLLFLLEEQAERNRQGSLYYKEST